MHKYQYAQIRAQHSKANEMNFHNVITVKAATNAIKTSQGSLRS